MKKRKPKKIAFAAASLEQTLQAVVYKNEAVRVESLPGGGLVATVPLHRPGWLVPPISWLVPFSPQRRIQLDELGAEVFGLCDGQRTVEDIIAKFGANHKLTFREAQLAVGTFLRQLTERGLVALVGMERDNPSP